MSFGTCPLTGRTCQGGCFASRFDQSQRTATAPPPSEPAPANNGPGEGMRMGSLYDTVQLYGSPMSMHSSPHGMILMEVWEFSPFESRMAGMASLGYLRALEMLAETLLALAERQLARMSRLDHFAESAWFDRANRFFRDTTPIDTLEQMSRARIVSRVESTRRFASDLAEYDAVLFQLQLAVSNEQFAAAVAQANALQRQIVRGSIDAYLVIRKHLDDASLPGRDLGPFFSPETRLAGLVLEPQTVVLRSVDAVPTFVAEPVATRSWSLGRVVGGDSPGMIDRSKSLSQALFPNKGPERHREHPNQTAALVRWQLASSRQRTLERHWERPQHLMSV